MYSYYLWSTFSPKPQEGRRPKWTEPAYYKQWVTGCQMLQFTVMFAQATYDISVKNPYPKFCAQILFYYMMTLLALFGNFAYQNYCKGKKRGPKPAGGVAGSATSDEGQRPHTE